MEYKIKSGELVFNVCPECGNAKGNCQVSLVPGKEGVVHCWCCDFAGNISRLQNLPGWSRCYQVYSTLVSTSGVEAEKAEVLVVPEQLVRVDFMNNPKFMRYLALRYVTIEDAVNWNVYVKESLGQSQDDWMFFFYPSYKEPAYWVAKNIVTERYLLPQYPKSTFVWYVQSEHKDMLVLVEGVFDAIRVWQAGYSVIVLLGKQLYKNVKSFIENYHADKKIVVGLDSDALRSASDIFESLKGLNLYSVVFTQEEKRGNADLGSLSSREVKHKIEQAERVTLSTYFRFRLGKV